MPELTARLIDITCETLQIDRRAVTATARFAEDLGADSMECVELMIAIEDAFGIEFSDEDVPGLTTIAEVACYIRQAAAGPPASATRQPAHVDAPKQIAAVQRGDQSAGGVPRPAM